MADSKMAIAQGLDGEKYGLICQASAWRVKYRRKWEDGSVKRRWSIWHMGVHQGNRGGVYPQQDDVRGLGKRLVELGYSQDEADHQGVCVEEVPAEHRSRGEGKPPLESITEFNRTRCSGQEYLMDAFGEHTLLQVGLLSHSHLMLVLRCWQRKAKWNLQGCSGELLFCTPDGRLDVAAAVASANMSEMKNSLDDGLLMETLSWEMTTEEPTAASLISRAMNCGHEVALRTTELTAVAVLAGEIGKRRSADVAAKMEFVSVKQSVAHQLDVIVDEPDFIALFECLISLGAGVNTYIPELLDFGSKFVNQKKRQLRLCAFAEVNKIPAQFPRTKVAVLKRAYRETPKNGFCPNPETAWARVPEDRLTSLEQLLQYFHTRCETAVAVWPNPKAQVLFLANVDVAAADAFIKSKVSSTKKDLMLATWKFVLQLRAAQAADPDAGNKFRRPWTLEEPEAKWLAMDLWQAAVAAAEAEAAAVGAVPERATPQVLQFNEKTGELLNQQPETQPTKESTQPNVLPWGRWMAAEGTRALGRVAAAKEAALTVMHLLHEGGCDAPVGVNAAATGALKINGGTGIHVVALKELPADNLRLFPVAPMGKLMDDTCLHPRRVLVLVSAALSSVDSTSPAVAVAEPASKFFVVPEFKGPKWCEQKKEWQYDGRETMYPFWAVTHAKEGEAANCQLRSQSFTVVACGPSTAGQLSTSYTVTVPMMTNGNVISLGATLLMPSIPQEKKKPEVKRAAWKAQLSVDAHNAKNSKSSRGSGSVGAKEI